MIFIIGLGNPGKKFQKSRHNIGRLIVGCWQEVIGFPNFKLQKKFNALISKGIYEKKDVILILPETLMNLSGKAVKALSVYYKLPTTNVWIIHDDIDILVGQIRIVKNRGSGGHKGVESIVKELKTKNFIRFRIGIQSKDGKPKNVEKYVLQKFGKAEEKVIEKTVEKTCLAITMVLKENLEKTMTRMN